MKYVRDETLREVRVAVYVDGVAHAQAVAQVPAWAVDRVTTAALVQVEDPDLEDEG